jgi:hypothetical protein
MKAMRNIVDTWNMIEKFGITEYTTTNSTIEISDEDFQKILNGSLNKKYINNLLASNGRFCSHEYI